jgi:hypothetical protein
LAAVPVNRVVDLRSLIDPTKINQALDATKELFIGRRKLRAMRAARLVIGRPLFYCRPMWQLVQKWHLQKGALGFDDWSHN